MSRARSRAGKRRARRAALLERFARAREDPGTLAALVTELVRRDVAVWPVAEEAARGRPLTGSERALIAQIVAPHLAGKTPGNVHRRHERGESPSPSLRLPAETGDPTGGPVR